MKDFKKDFPIFDNNLWLVYLDNAASTQKPRYVIEWIKNFLENDYANIHRWAYMLSERSEELFDKSKKKIAEFIWADYASEINYTYNANYAFNIISQSIKKSWLLNKWDKILLSIAEHHANIVPWLMLKEEIWIEIDYIKIKDDYSLDLEDLRLKLNGKVKIISLSYASNVTWEIFELEKVWEILNDKYASDKPIFIVDASQAVPNFKVDIKRLGCDFLVFTAHKVMAETGLWIFYGKKELLKKLTPSIWWGGAINWVKKQDFSPAWLPNRFEIWTPNIIWAISLLKAFEYIQSIGWYETIENNEKILIKYFLEKLQNYPQIKLIGSKNLKNRLWIFSLEIPEYHIADLAEIFAEDNICIRAWMHCAEPLADTCNNNWSLRVSFYLYNDVWDIDRFFEVLNRIYLVDKKW